MAPPKPPMKAPDPAPVTEACDILAACGNVYGALGDKLSPQARYEFEQVANEFVLMGCARLRDLAVVLSGALAEGATDPKPLDPSAPAPGDTSPGSSSDDASPSESIPPGPPPNLSTAPGDGIPPELGQPPIAAAAPYDGTTPAAI